MANEKFQLTREQRRIRELLETEYPAMEKFLVQHIESVEEFVEDYRNETERLQRMSECRKSIEEVTYILLCKMNAPVNLRGYKYTREAIEICAKADEDKNLKITKDIYPYLAKKHGTTISAVERAIRHFISKLDCSYLFRYGYNFDSIATNNQFIMTVALIVKQLMDTEKSEANASKVKAVVIQEVTVSRKVDCFLNAMAIPNNIKGYKALQIGIRKYFEHHGEIKMMDLYNEIAIEMQSTACRAERSIRHAVGVAFARTPQEKVSEIFGCDFGKDHNPTNSEFIAMVASKLQN